jgi:hypothetical protein
MPDGVRDKGERQAVYFFNPHTRGDNRVRTFLATTLLDAPDVPTPALEEQPHPTPHRHQYHSVSVCPVDSILSVSVCPVNVESHVTTVELALAIATPARERNDSRLFLLARALLAVEAHTGHTLSPAELMTAFTRWHDTGLQTGQLDPAKTRDNYLTKFMSAKAKAKKPLGPILDFEAVIAELNTRPLPPEAALFESDPPQRLVGLCKLLQEHAGDAPFFLACRKAASAIGLAHTEAANYLSALVGVGLLTEISKGKGCRASRYRFNSTPNPTS